MTVKQNAIRLVAVCALATIGASQATGQGARHEADVIMPESGREFYDKWHYAPAVKVNGMIYLSGVIAAPVAGAEDPEAAGYARAWEQIATTLDLAGASLDDVVEITTFHVDMPAQIETFAAVKDRYITGPYPAWTAIDIDRLFSEDGLVEIRVTAAVSSQ